MVRTLLPLAALALALPAPAQAGELFGALLTQGTLRPLSDDIGDRGAALQLGWRSGRIAALAPIGAPQAHAFGSVNTKGGTDFIAGGLSWRLGGRIYVRPGIGLAVHNGPIPRSDGNGDRTDLGSRLLFEPELAVGVGAGPVSVELAWVHLSHATIFSNQNPGLDMLGLRVNLRLP
jgi:lipid A 3-O-deacylase